MKERRATLTKLFGAIFLLVFLVLSGMPAYADPCVAGPLSSVVGTSCTIGNATYSFTKFVGVATAFPSVNFESTILFQPDSTTIPGAVGFTLSSSYFDTPAQFDLSALSLDYTAVINSIVAYQFSAITTTASQIGTQEFGYVLVAGGGHDVGGVGQCGNESSAYADSANFVGLPSSSSLWCASPDVAANAYVETGGPAFLGAAGYYLDERLPGQIALGDTGGGAPMAPRFAPNAILPEPGSLTLLITGLLSMGAALRRKTP